MTTLTAARAAASFPVAGDGAAMDVKVATGTKVLATNPTAADIIQFCKVPKNCVVFAGWLMGDDIDSGAEELEIDMGWAANGVEALDADGFGNFGVISGDAVSGIKPEVSIYLPFGGVLRTTGPQFFSAETIIQGTVVVDAQAGGTGTLTATVLYFMDPNFSLT